MVAKPPTCQGCPMEQDGKGFVPDEIIPGAPVFVLGQNPGQEEERQGVPFVGKSGTVMNTRYLPAAGLFRGVNVSIGNTVRCRWIVDGKRTNTLPPAKVLSVAVEHCTREHLHIPEGTQLVIAQGAVALKALTGDKKISIYQWRGGLINT